MKKELKDRYVYLHRDVNNTIFYVGVGGKHRPNFRYLRSKEHNDITKLGHSVEIHKDNLTLSEAFEIEIDLIELIGRKDLGLGTLVNKTSGGAGAPGTITSDLTRSRMSKAQKGRIITQETREKLRKAVLGKKLSQETKDKMSKALKGVKKPKGFGAKVALANSKRVYKDSSREKVRLHYRRKSMSDEVYSLLLNDYSKIDKVIKGITFKELQKKYNLSYRVIKSYYDRYKKNK